jgi:hypothetical protein
MLTITYRNNATGELETVEINRPHGSNSNQLVASHAKVVCRKNGWKASDVVAQMVIVSA